MNKRLVPATQITYRRACISVLLLVLAAAALAGACVTKDEFTGGAQCSSDAECGDAAPCAAARCLSGACTMETADAGTPCGPTMSGLCNGKGQCLVPNGAMCSVGAECASGDCISLGADAGTCTACNPDGGVECPPPATCVNGYCQ